MHSSIFIFVFVNTWFCHTLICKMYTLFAKVKTVLLHKEVKLRRTIWNVIVCVTPIVLHVTNHKHVTYRYILVYISSIHLHIPCSSVVCKSLPFFVSLFLQVWEDDEGVCTPIYNCPTSPADQTFLIMKVSPIIQNVFFVR